MITNEQTKIILQTERLILRTWQPADVFKMAEISGDPIVMEYSPETKNLDQTKKLIEYSSLHFKKHGFGFLPVEIKHTNEFIGFVGLNIPNFEIPGYQPPCLPIVEIGWRLSSLHWGQGYASEAARAVIHHAFTDLKLEEIISFTLAANTRSRRVMEKIGFHHDENNDFYHPALPKDSPFSRQVFYKLNRAEYQFSLKNSLTELIT